MADTFENKINALKEIYKGRVPDDDLKKITNEAMKLIVDMRESKVIKYGLPAAAAFGDTILTAIAIFAPVDVLSKRVSEIRLETKEQRSNAKQVVIDELEKKLKALAKSPEKPKQSKVSNVIGQYVGAGAGHGIVGVQQERRRPSEDELLASLPESLREKVKKTFEPKMPRSDM